LTAFLIMMVVGGGAGATADAVVTAFFIWDAKD
jgi:hypothetical protein